MSRTIRIATRSSPMALHQAEQVATALETLQPGLTTELVKVTTAGDRVDGRPVQARRQGRVHQGDRPRPAR